MVKLINLINRKFGLFGPARIYGHDEYDKNSNRNFKAILTTCNVFGLEVVVDNYEDIG